MSLSDRLAERRGLRGIAALQPFAIAAAAMAVAAVSFLAVQMPGLLRPIIVALVVGTAAFVSVRRPGLAVGITFAFLVVLALIRRLLIPVAGWSYYDPLLLAAPVICLFLFQRTLLDRTRALAPDTLSRLVLGLLAVTILEAANPLGGGLLAGLAALLFIGAPLVWFFVGRAIATRRGVGILLACVLVFAVLDALYGLRQTLVGLPSWDSAWVDVAGYAALRIHGVLRAFGTFASSGEYATYLGIALVLSLAFALKRRVLALLAVPLLGWAIFLESSRGVIVLALASALVLIGLRMRHALVGLAVVVLTVLAIGAGLIVFGPALESSALASANPLVAHQLGGLLHPFDPNQSTLVGHWDQILGGFQHGLSNPLGLGTGAATIAGDKFGGAASVGSENDISNAFVGLGIPGGVLYMAVVLLTFRNVFALYRRTSDVAVFCVAGILILTLGEWLNGGQYAVAPLIWFLIGWTDQAWTASSRQEAAVP